MSVYTFVVLALGLAIAANPTTSFGKPRPGAAKKVLAIDLKVSARGGVFKTDTDKDSSSYEAPPGWFIESIEPVEVVSKKGDFKFGTDVQQFDWVKSKTNEEDYIRVLQEQKEKATSEGREDDARFYREQITKFTRHVEWFKSRSSRLIGSVWVKGHAKGDADNESNLHARFYVNIFNVADFDDFEIGDLKEESKTTAGVTKMFAAMRVDSTDLRPESIHPLRAISTIDYAEDDGKPSQVAIAVDGKEIYWVDSKHRFRQGHVNDEGKLVADRTIDGPEPDGKPSQVAIAVENGKVYWVDSRHRFRVGQVGPNGKLKADMTIDGPEDGKPSQVAIAVDGDAIYWVDAKHQFRKGHIGMDDKLKADKTIDTAESDGRPSQVCIAVEDGRIYWVDSDHRFRQGVVDDTGKLKAVGRNIDGAERNGKPSQLMISVEEDRIYWVDSKYRFRIGKVQ